MATMRNTWTYLDCVVRTGRAWLRTEGDLKIEVRILDARWVFGSAQALIEPVAGGGQKWVNVDRLSWTDPTHRPDERADDPAPNRRRWIWR